MADYNPADSTYQNLHLINPHPHPHSHLHTRTPSAGQDGGGRHNESDVMSSHSHQTSIAAAGQPYMYSAQPAFQAHLSYKSEPTNVNGVAHVIGRAEGGQKPDHASDATSRSRDRSDKPKAVRLRKACDACSSRKVKCDNLGPPCQPCSEFGVPCTNNRPSKRRGPKNQQIEAIKRRRFDQSGGEGSGGEASGGDSGEYISSLHQPRGPRLTSPSSAMAVATMASLAQAGQQVGQIVTQQLALTAESICSFETIILLVDDFFLYLHPLCPFPHEPSFRSAFTARHDLENLKFLALLASMVGVLVASFPRRAFLHLKAHRQEHLFSNSMSLVHQCHKVAVAARGAGYLDNDPNIYDAVTSYFLGLSAAYTLQWQQARLYFGETLTITRIMGTHTANDDRARSAAYGAAVEGQYSNNQSPPVDHIKEQIGRRLFWIMFVSIRSMQQLGARFGELLIPPPTPKDPYPEFPQEVDDEYIFENRIEPQPASILSKLVGYNLNIKIYHTVTPLATMELAYGIDEVFDWETQRRVLEECLSSVKQILTSTPHVLLWQSILAHGETQPSDDRQYYPPLHGQPDHRAHSDEPQMLNANSEARRELQFEIQKANIYASQLGTRSFIIEKYWSLQEAHERNNLEVRAPQMNSDSGSVSQKESIETQIEHEQENIVEDLLTVLSSICQVNLDANGGTFMRFTQPATYYVFHTDHLLKHNKILQIASNLLKRPPNRKVLLVVRNEEYLNRFVDVLKKLERVGIDLHNEPCDTVEDEDEELRNWADLQEFQSRFVQTGSFLNQQ